MALRLQFFNNKTDRNVPDFQKQTSKRPETAFRRKSDKVVCKKQGQQIPKRDIYPLLASCVWGLYGVSEK